MFLRKDFKARDRYHCLRFAAYLFFFGLFSSMTLLNSYARKITHTEEDVGLLVQLGFDITAFTPTAYQRGSLPRPSKDDSS